MSLCVYAFVMCVCIILFCKLDQLALYYIIYMPVLMQTDYACIHCVLYVLVNIECTTMGLTAPLQETLIKKCII